ncbi:MAG: hypothetical protein JWP91_3105 [Fibrobacteres bacterium]|nr:hypothetical protein [Fibrobacterota bacterium]
MHSNPTRSSLALASSVALVAFASFLGTAAAQDAPKFKVLGFSTTKSDAGHVSYEHEANRWLPKIAKQYGFSYDSTKVWTDCNTAKLSQYQVVIFMDERPEDPGQRAAIRKYMADGGGLIACHGAAFEMAGSEQAMNWPWYHDSLFESGEYKSNTWRPTSAFLKREDSTHPFMKGLPALFKSSPNEWYRWKVDLRTKPDIKILLSIDPSSFPLGTGPKPEEIWYDGYYPVAWTNTRYKNKMLYVNMGHNDLNSPATGKDSQTFDNDIQNKLFINALLIMGGLDPTAVAKPAVQSAAKPIPKTAAGFHLKGAGMTASKTRGAEAGESEFDLHGRAVSREASPVHAVEKAAAK